MIVGKVYIGTYLYLLCMISDFIDFIYFDFINAFVKLQFCCLQLILPTFMSVSVDNFVIFVMLMKEKELSKLHISTQRM